MGLIEKSLRRFLICLRDLELEWLKTTSDPKLKELIQYSLVLEGLNRHPSTHAAGVVIAPGI
jgi:DNA polymerase III alpha subunit